MVLKKIAIGQPSDENIPSCMQMKKLILIECTAL
jgi:hypothetical protein